MNLRLRKEGEAKWIAPVEKANRTIAEALQKSIKTPFSMCDLLSVGLAIDNIYSPSLHSNDGSAA